MTSCDEPYIGDESITLPPASTKLRMTSVHASRATGSSPTLNVIQLPRPTTGSVSPVDGIGRVRIVRDWASAAEGRSAAHAPAAASVANTRRRFHIAASSGAMAAILLRPGSRPDVRVGRVETVRSHERAPGELYPRAPPPRLLCRDAVADAFARERHVHRVPGLLHRHAHLAVVSIVAEGDRTLDGRGIIAGAVHLVDELVADALALDDPAVALLGNELLILSILADTDAVRLRRHGHRHPRHFHLGRDLPEVVFPLSRRRQRGGEPCGQHDARTDARRESVAGVHTRLPRRYRWVGPASVKIKRAIRRRLARRARRAVAAWKTERVSRRPCPSRGPSRTRSRCRDLQ